MKTACSRILILENLRSVENTASIFRTADCMGISNIILVGTTPTPFDRFARKRRDFAKISLGAEDMIDWKYEKEIGPVLEELQKQKFKIIILEQHSSSEKLQVMSYNLGNFALIVGNEVTGVSAEAMKIAERIIEIPMLGKKESLNVSVALGIALFVLK